MGIATARCQAFPKYHPNENAQAVSLAVPFWEGLRRGPVLFDTIKRLRSTIYINRNHREQSRGRMSSFPGY